MNDIFYASVGDAFFVMESDQLFFGYVHYYIKNINLSIRILQFF
ncbi:MAG: hypothetical protein JG775_230 [Defluviitaleaceae bacterium]|jgi:hypothetical protein|nr:hypothetical protein [Defluviitaleaceae bacterium]